MGWRGPFLDRINFVVVPIMTMTMDEIWSLNLSEVIPRTDIVHRGNRENLLYPKMPPSRVGERK